MNDKQYLGQLKVFTSNAAQWNAFVEYINDEIDILNRTLQQSDSSVVIQRTQGAVHMLQRIAKLKEMCDGQR